MEISRVMFFVNCFKYIAVPFMVQNYGVASRCVTEWNKAIEEFCAFHILDHIDGCWLNSGSRNIICLLGSIFDM